ncbi:MAG: glycosyltransferase family 2 protein, partial [Gammaproteobacteria bacterium]
AKRGGDIYRHCLPRCVISPSAVVLHREVLETTGLFDESLPACEDYDLWLRICANFPVLYIDAPLVIKYGGHDDQLSRRYWGMDRFRIQALEKILASARLSRENYSATLETLLDKLAIVIQGAEKRNNRELATRYRNKLESYRQMETLA